MDLSHITFREKVENDDPEKVRDIVNSTGFFNEEEILIAVELVDETLARGSKSGYEFIFLEAEGKMLGYVCYGRISGTKSSYDLYWIAVHRDYQKHSLGRKILKCCEKRIKEMDGERVYLETSGSEKYIPTRSFYEKCGYKVAAVLEDFYNHGDDKVIYVNKLQ